MKILDGDEDRLKNSIGEPCVRDMVQFIEMNEILKGGGVKNQLEHEILKEIPGQVMEYGMNKKVFPKPVTLKDGRRSSFRATLIRSHSLRLNKEAESKGEGPAVVMEDDDDDDEKASSYVPVPYPKLDSSSSGIAKEREFLMSHASVAPPPPPAVEASAPPPPYEGSVV